MTPTPAIFIKVAERKSFVGAAAELGITQSGVSNAIRRLDDQIGRRFLARTTRRIPAWNKDAPLRATR
jgi:LysR family transcriptional regulator, regulator for bpeEF and oprC